jgi:dihydroorotase
MLNRRQFVCAAAAGAAAFARVSDVLAAPASYDLIIKGGRAIDPSLRVDEIRDVAIAGGRIAAVEANVAGDAAETLDARGKIVVPGLLDIHTHAARVKDGPSLCLADGVTGSSMRDRKERIASMKRWPSPNRRRSPAAC